MKLVKTLFFTIIAPTLLLGVSSVNAQTDDADAQSDEAGVLEEVLVLSRRREEALINVPVSVTVFTAADIDSAGIETPADFIALTPNVTMYTVQNVGNSFVTIRGISANRNSGPSVATVIDGVLQSNAGQFNQEIFDIQQIEVLRGPHGALYGRNAIGGAIIITTKSPGDEQEGRLILGADSGPGYKVQGAVSGPLGNSTAWKYRAAFSFKDTDGYINNPFLDEESDPYKDVSGRLKLLYQPSDNFSADFRASFSNLDSQGFNYQIRSPLPEPFPGAPISLGHGTGDPHSVNDTSLSVRVNNPGVNERDLVNLALKLDYETNLGTLTSITSFDTLEELNTGDAFDFVPIPESIGVAFGFPDQNQSQYLDLETISQEIRFTSSADNRLRWIAGGYLIATDRFISTGNMVDTGGGVFPVFREPRGNFPFDFATDSVNPSATYLADSQDNFAWALFGELAYDISDDLEAAVSLRYDHDKRENTTETPTAFIIPVAGVPTGAPGDVRKETWDDLQPKVSLRYKASDRTTFYGSFSSGFRSGGFNQTGVGGAAANAGIPGVGDIFDQETTDTFEVGFKGQYLNGRVSTSLSVYHTEAKGTYFFIFIAENSTQNLGNLDKVDYTGLEFELAANLADGFDVFLGLGLTDSEIKESGNASDIGDKAPNVSEYTLNLSAQYSHPLNVSNGMNFFARADFQVIGKTSFFDFQQADTNDRDAVNLLDARLGVEVANNWAVTLWAKNLFDEEYNTEYSTGGFVYKALPVRWGIDFRKDF